MKKRVAIIIIMVALALSGFCGYKMYDSSLDKRSVSYNGWLKVKGASIVNAKNREIQLVGVSTHGIQWFGDIYTPESVAYLKQKLGINVFRVAVYTDPESSGYVSNHELDKKIIELVDACVENDIYAIIDWHILNDGNPQQFKNEAIGFFDAFSKRYANNANVIYEICNEPNSGIDWENDIYPYANDVIGVIRNNSPKSLIIVGTGDWSTDLVSAAQKPLSDANVVYALHFYAGSHNKTMRDKIDEFREKGLAVFVSECGATDATGDGKIYEEAFGRWVDYMNENKISWVYWSYSNKDEASAMLKPNETLNYERFEDDEYFDSLLSLSGKLFERSIESSL